MYTAVTEQKWSEFSWHRGRMRKKRGKSFRWTSNSAVFLVTRQIQPSEASLRSQWISVSELNCLYCRSATADCFSVLHSWLSSILDNEVRVCACVQILQDPRQSLSSNWGGGKIWNTKQVGVPVAVYNCVVQVSGSNLEQVSGYREQELFMISLNLQANAGLYVEVGKRCFLLNPYLFTLTSFSAFSRPEWHPLKSFCIIHGHV